MKVATAVLVLSAPRVRLDPGEPTRVLRALARLPRLDGGVSVATVVMHERRSGSLQACDRGHRAETE